MKFKFTSIIALSCACIGLIAFAAQDVDFSAEQDGLLRHFVAFKFKDSASAEDIRGVVDAFRALPEKIPFIVSYEDGTNVSPEGFNKDFTHCFLLTFKTAADRDAYLPHPAHKEFGAMLGPYLDDVFVMDYWTK